MSQPLLFSLLALCVGALIPIQAATNASLSKALGDVVYPALVLFAIGLVTVFITIAVLRLSPPSLAEFSTAPRHGYVGGLIVAGYVLAITYLAPKMGVGNAICFIVSGQIIAAVIIDHYGFFTATETKLTLPRMAGISLMIVGLFLAKR